MTPFFQAVGAFLRSLIHEHGDAATGAILGATTSIAAFHLPGFADWPELLKYVMPLISGMAPVISKAVVQYLKPAGRGLCAGMRNKAAALRKRAEERSKAGDQKLADLLIDHAENLEAEAAAIDAAEGV